LAPTGPRLGDAAAWHHSPAQGMENAWAGCGPGNEQQQQQQQRRRRPGPAMECGMWNVAAACSIRDPCLAFKKWIPIRSLMAAESIASWREAAGDADFGRSLRRTAFAAPSGNQENQETRKPGFPNESGGK
ncbi:hypothetical protein E4U54_006564, partial [Claviceps lovelessii]